MKRALIITLVIAIMFAITGCSNRNDKEDTAVSSETAIEIVEPIEPRTEAVSETEYQIPEIPNWWWEGEKLSPDNSEVEGPSGIETYFNEDVSALVENAKEGYFGQYWETKDGVKMYGEYIICKCKYEANEYHPKLPVGTVIPTTIGAALVCSNDTDADISIAVTW